MGYSFTDLGAEGCRRSLNALLKIKVTKFSVISVSTWLENNDMQVLNSLDHERSFQKQDFHLILVIYILSVSLKIALWWMQMPHSHVTQCFLVTPYGDMDLGQYWLM